MSNRKTVMRVVFPGRKKRRRRRRWNPNLGRLVSNGCSDDDVEFDIVEVPPEETKLPTGTDEARTAYALAIAAVSAGSTPDSLGSLSSASTDNASDWYDLDSQSADGSGFDIQSYPADTAAIDNVKKRRAWHKLREPLLRAYLRSLWNPMPQDTYSCDSCNCKMDLIAETYRSAWAKCAACDSCSRHCIRCIFNKHDDAHLQLHPFQLYDMKEKRWVSPLDLSIGWEHEKLQLPEDHQEREEQQEEVAEDTSGSMEATDAIERKSQSEEDVFSEESGGQQQQQQQEEVEVDIDRSLTFDRTLSLQLFLLPCKMNRKSFQFHTVSVLHRRSKEHTLTYLSCPCHRAETLVTLGFWPLTNPNKLQLPSLALTIDTMKVFCERRFASPTPDCTFNLLSYLATDVRRKYEKHLSLALREYCVLRNDLRRLSFLRPSLIWRKSLLTCAICCLRAKRNLSLPAISFDGMQLPRMVRPGDGKFNEECDALGGAIMHTEKEGCSLREEAKAIITRETLPCPEEGLCYSRCKAAKDNMKSRATQEYLGVFGAVCKHECVITASIMT